MPTKHEVIGVVTNLSVNVDVYRRVKRKMHLNASFHREFATQEQFIEKIHRLADHFHIHVNIVATPENLPVLAEVSRQFTAEKISLHVDPYVDQSYSYSQEQRELLKKHIQSDRDPSKQLDYSNGIKKKCSAGRNYVNIGPDGSAFTCSGGMGYVYSPLYASLVNGESTDAFRMGNIFSPDFRLNTEDMMCTLPCKEACDRDAAIIKIV